MQRTIICLTMMLFCFCGTISAQPAIEHDSVKISIPEVHALNNVFTDFQMTLELLDLYQNISSAQDSIIEADKAKIEALQNRCKLLEGRVNELVIRSGECIADKERINTKLKNAKKYTGWLAAYSLVVSALHFLR